jgi:hypothetical protein
MFYLCFKPVLIMCLFGIYVLFLTTLSLGLFHPTYIIFPIWLNKMTLPHDKVFTILIYIIYIYLPGF